jgi:hypothetical protein
MNHNGNTTTVVSHVLHAIIIALIMPSNTATEQKIKVNISLIKYEKKFTNIIY